MVTVRVLPPALNEIWYVKLPGATALSTVKIVELTTATVVLAVKSLPSEAGYRSICGRYWINDIAFIEKA